MNDKVVTLPWCGGKAWLRTRLTESQMGDYEDTRTTRLPSAALTHMAKAWRDGTLSRDATAEEDTNFLMAAGFGAPELRAAGRDADRRVIEIVCRRWSDVRGPESDDLLEFPTGVPMLDPDDFNALLVGCYQAITEGRADPNDGKPPSKDTSLTPEDGLSLTSQETSGTLTDSTLRVVAKSA